MIKNINKFLRGAHWAPLMISAILWVNCANNPDEVEALYEATEGATVTLTNVRLFYSELGQTRLKVEARKWEDFSDDDKNPRYVFSQGIEATLMDSSQRTLTTMLADMAIYKQVDQEWMVSGNIEIREPLGRTIRTQEILWDRKEKRLKGDGPVRILDQGNEIIGNHGFEANEDLSEITYFSAEGNFSLNDSQ